MIRLAARLSQRLRDPQQARLRQLAAQLPHLQLDRRVQAFYYLSLHGHAAPDHYRIFQAGLTPLLGQLAPAQLQLLLQSYARHRTFFSDAAKFQKALNSTVARFLGQMRGEQEVRTLLIYSQRLTLHGRELVTQLLRAAVLTPLEYSAASRTRIVLAAVESTEFPFELVGKGLAIVCSSSAELADSSMLITLGYLLFSELLERMVAATRDTRKARLELKGYEIDLNRQEDDFLQKVKQLRVANQPLLKTIEEFVRTKQYSLSLLVLACEFLPADSLRTRITETLTNRVAQVSPFEAVSLCRHLPDKTLLASYKQASIAELSPEEVAFLDRQLASLE